ncbi:MAG: tyrosine-type recombinase/integrase [Cytophagales bacterium]|nr:tyrosine-type recombinase/integrase [Cytophagales bacterium]
MAGRPLGSFENVALDIHLGLHHFAFLRSGAEGLDLVDAAERYMLCMERIDARTAKALERRLLRQVIAAAEALNDVTASIQLEALTCENDQAISDFVPSLDDFADEHGGSDFYGQDELLALYNEKYGDIVAQVERRASVIKRRISALEALQNRLTRIPRGDDAALLWLPQELALRLREHGVVTLDNMVTFINAAGRTWHRKIKRLGSVRARRLLMWITQNQEIWREQLKPSIAQLASNSKEDALNFAPSLQASSVIACSESLSNSHTDRAVQFGLVPLDWLDIPEHLSGAHGLFRAHDANTINADTDIQAIQAWFTTLAAKSSNTLTTYKREIERFYLWCLLEAGKPLSSIDATDCMAFRAFILKPPAHWVCALPVARSSSDWRPFRGALTARSASLSLTAVSALFKALHGSRYLFANPMPSITSSASAVVKVDVSRSFTEQDKQGIKDVLMQLPNRPTSTRLRAAVVLLLTSGLRMSELSQATWADIEPMRIEGYESNLMQLRIVGKGLVERLIPIREEVLEALRAHQADMIELGLLNDSDPSKSPLLCAIHNGVGSVHRRSGRAWTAPGIYRALKRLFARVAKTPAAAHSSSDFKKASGHWLRHTFGHAVLKSSGDRLPVVQQLLGHSSITTTAIYVKADMSARAVAIASLPDF